MKVADLIKLLKQYESDTEVEIEVTHASGFYYRPIMDIDSHFVEDYENTEDRLYSSDCNFKRILIMR